MSDIVCCPSCKMNVVPKSDGRCPSCASSLTPSAEREASRDPSIKGRRAAGRNSSGETPIARPNELHAAAIAAGTGVAAGCMALFIGAAFKTDLRQLSADRTMYLVVSLLVGLGTSMMGLAIGALIGAVACSQRSGALAFGAKVGCKAWIVGVAVGMIGVGEIDLGWTLLISSGVAVFLCVVWSE